eukprot:CAMPEP_0198729578 /NCGR_PEP_ID=MMETSP1475-20131203/19728_1 /TAXON_ID= ORGANISM="Unidentified sp., Strain CCMP1999" /NCGR_SAMPLE_ID=MMETSP1475 /ASSEMBLY_ACC=CAM_ASM_001111 /LENGTH=454 /DNA_ID=CAMNT_0044492267 /DNA_START=106 /DNA_END=1470 /DNA_ORIENTATION=-
MERQDETSRKAPEHGSVNAYVLREVNHLYRTAKPENVKVVADMFGQDCVPPRRRVHVMVVGNHSAGKSTFINWYMGQPVLQTGVAVESTGFTVVTTGNRRETLRGPATMDAFEYLRPLRRHDGFVDCLRTELIDSSARNNDLVSFVDTPGLTDGDLRYSCAVDDVIVDMAENMDLVLVFLDPIGQALCSRTMKIVQRLNERHREKLHLYLSKADTIERADDRHKVLFQIAQGLGAIKNHAAELPMIFVPTVTENKALDECNSIDKVCKLVDDAVETGVQDALNQVQEDTNEVLDRIEASEKMNASHIVHNKRMLFRHSLLIFIGILSMIYPATLIFSIFMAVLPETSLESLRMETLRNHHIDGHIYRLSYLLASSRMSIASVHRRHPMFLVTCLTVFVLCGLLIRMYTQRRSVLTAEQTEKVNKYREHILAAKKRRSELYAMYISQSLHPDGSL